MKLQPLLLTACLLGSLGAFAQTATTSDATGTAPEARQTRPMQKMRDMMVKQHSRHLEELKTNLKLKPEQETAWTAFANSMQARSPETSPMAGADMAKLTTPERIDKMKAMHAEHDAEMQKRADATKAFYANLSDDQKKTFDQHTSKFMHRMGGDHHAGHGHMMHKL